MAAIFCHTATVMVQIENSSFQQFALVQGLQNFRGLSNTVGVIRNETLIFVNFTNKLVGGVLESSSSLLEDVHRDI